MSRTLQHMIETLSYGHLANLAIGGSGTGEVPANKLKQIVHLLNQGLTELHSRFMLYQRELFIRVQEGRTLYTLIPQAGESYEDPPGASTFSKYIIDVPEAPFLGDVIRILECHAPKLDCPDQLEELAINDLEAPRSVFTPATDTIQITDGKAGDIFQFIYQAEHYQLEETSLNQVIYLPEYLYSALEDYVAWKVFSSMNGAEHRETAMAYLSSYQLALNSVVELDLISTTNIVTNTKLEQRGFK